MNALYWLLCGIVYVIGVLHFGTKVMSFWSAGGASSSSRSVMPSFQIMTSSANNKSPSTMTASCSIFRGSSPPASTKMLGSRGKTPTAFPSTSRSHSTPTTFFPASSSSSQRQEHLPHSTPPASNSPPVGDPGPLLERRVTAPGGLGGGYSPFLHDGFVTPFEIPTRAAGSASTGSDIETRATAHKHQVQEEQKQTSSANTPFPRTQTVPVLALQSPPQAGRNALLSSSFFSSEGGVRTAQAKSKGGAVSSLPQIPKRRRALGTASRGVEAGIIEEDGCQEEESQAFPQQSRAAEPVQQALDEQVPLPNEDQENRSASSSSAHSTARAFVESVLRDSYTGFGFLWAVCFQFVAALLVASLADETNENQSLSGDKNRSAHTATISYSEVIRMLAILMSSHAFSEKRMSTRKNEGIFIGAPASKDRSNTKKDENLDIEEEHSSASSEDHRRSSQLQSYGEFGRRHGRPLISLDHLSRISAFEALERYLHFQGGPTIAKCALIITIHRRVEALPLVAVFQISFNSIVFSSNE
ncbi:unnamed protein product [Amoebophrya sp. A25]|nr:unnamed protein product [Amoebophrya sp. A25]|eukprot:GSA25T00023213001.1